MSVAYTLYSLQQATWVGMTENNAEGQGFVQVHSQGEHSINKYLIGA